MTQPRRQWACGPQRTGTRLHLPCLMVCHACIIIGRVLFVMHLACGSDMSNSRVPIQVCNIRNETQYFDSSHISTARVGVRRVRAGGPGVSVRSQCPEAEPAAGPGPAGLSSLSLAKLSNSNESVHVKERATACARAATRHGCRGSAVREKGTRLFSLLVTAENNRTVPSARGLRGAE